MQQQHHHQPPSSHSPNQPTCPVAAYVTFRRERPFYFTEHCQKQKENLIKNRHTYVKCEPIKRLSFALGLT